MSESRWVLREPKPGAVEQLAGELAVSPAMAAVLVNRGVETAAEAEAYWHPDPAALHAPDAFAEMGTATERIETAIRNGEHIRVYGDYDVDGISGSTLLLKQLRRRKATADFAVPNRFIDGYGLKPPAVERAAADGVRVLITVDNGSTAYDAHAAARAAGIDLIVCDHHTLGPHRPDVLAHLNPKAPESHYPFPDLCGAGVAWKLAQALGASREELTQYAVLGTIADIVPLRGENRVIAALGLPRLTEAIAKGDPGLRALASVSGILDKPVTGYHVGFQLGPRLNAAGRMDDAGLGVQLLLSPPGNNVQRLAQLLDDANTERRGIQDRIFREAVAQVEADFNPDTDFGFVLADPDWHPGVIGIVASKIVETFGRPAILIGIDDNGMGKGSGRSINGFDLHAALTECREYFIDFGGHVMAAGLTIKEEDIFPFQDAFNAVCRSMLAPEDLVPRVVCDAELPLADATLEFATALERGAPYGAGNPTPQFLVRNVQLDGELRILKQQHLKFRVQQGGSRSVDCIAFSMSEHAELVRGGTPLDLAARVEINEWQGRRSLQLQVRAVRPHVP